MSRLVAIDDLIDAHDVAALLGLSHHNTVSVYQHRYRDMPQPAVDLGKGRVKLWLRPEIERWRVELEKGGRTRRRQRAAR